MPTFTRSDRAYFARALASVSSHASLNTLEEDLLIPTQEGGVAARASAAIRHITSAPDSADAVLLELLNRTFVDDAYSIDRRATDTYQDLLVNVLGPRGVTLTEDGFVIEGATPVPQNDAAQESSANGVDARDSYKVFIVHGRDTRPREVLKEFLQFCGLGVMDWEDAVKRTGKSQPHTFEVVKAGIEAAAATVVIFSPDEHVTLKPQFASEPGDEGTYAQARPNVLLEAGMAFVLAPQRTIFLHSGKSREISDISGFNWVKMNGVYGSRRDLVNRLEMAGAAVRLVHENLLDTSAGTFLVPLD